MQTIPNGITPWGTRGPFHAIADSSMTMEIATPEEVGLCPFTEEQVCEEEESGCNRELKTGEEGTRVSQCSSFSESVVEGEVPSPNSDFRKSRSSAAIFDFFKAGDFLPSGPRRSSARLC